MCDHVKQPSQAKRTLVQGMNQTLSFKQSAGCGGQDEAANCSSLQSHPFQCFVGKIGEIQRITANEDYEDDSALE